MKKCYIEPKKQSDVLANHVISITWPLINIRAKTRKYGGYKAHHLSRRSRKFFPRGKTHVKMIKLGW